MSILIETLKHTYGVFKLKRINKKISGMTLKRQANLAKARALNTEYEELKTALSVREGEIRAKLE